MSQFSVLIVTAPPPGVSGDAGGAHAKIDGREILLRSAELFVSRDNVKQVQLAFLPDALEEGKRKYGGHLSFTGVKIISGGPRWLDQLIAAAPTVAAECTHVLVHDAARPSVPYGDIDALMDASAKAAAVALVAPCRNMLVELDEGSQPMAFTTPGNYMQMLTPVIYAKNTFLEIAKTRKELHASAYTLVQGSPLNIRVNSSAEAALVKAMLNLLPKPKVKAPSSPFEEAQW